MLYIRTARLIISEPMRYAIGLDVTLGNHKKVAWTTFLLIILAFSAVPISFSMQSSRSISATGMINHMTAYTKKVIWDDGSTEIIEITRQGSIVLNGHEIIACGFHITGLGGGQQLVWNDTIGNMVLNRLESDGVRFIALSIVNEQTYSEQNIRGFVNYWMPKFYSHKMYVVVQVAHKGIDRPPNIYPDYQFPFISWVIDLFNKKPWSDIIIAWNIGWEWDSLDNNPNLTAEQMNASLSRLYPLIKEKLRDTLIGEIPLFSKNVLWKDYGTGTIQMLKYSDVPGWDLYLLQNDDGSIEQPRMDNRMKSYQEQALLAAGKSGYKVWWGEAGLYKNQSKMADRSIFDYLLFAGGYNNCAAMFIWEIWSVGQPTWHLNAFNSDGTPKAWYFTVVSYFPKLD